MKTLAEDKAKLQEQLTETKEAINFVSKDNDSQKQEIGQDVHNMEIMAVDLEKLRRDQQVLDKESSQFHAENEKIAKTVPELKERIESLRQKIQLNEMLKEVDLDEIKMLKQNNMSVNSAIANLITRWETLEGK